MGSSVVERGADRGNSEAPGGMEGSSVEFPSKHGSAP